MKRALVCLIIPRVCINSLDTVITGTTVRTGDHSQPGRLPELPLLL